MAAFSYQNHPPFLLESVFLPNPPIKMSAFSGEPNNTTACFSHQIYQPAETLQQIPVDVSVHESSFSEHSTKVALSPINEPSVTNKHSTDSSSVVDKSENSEQVSQIVSPMDKKRKIKGVSSFNSAGSKDPREAMKSKKQKKCNGVRKNAEEKKPKEDKKVAGEAPTGYIHVRARRGQATDSHSLAERIRREKISERMKMLQALVPGCDKVTGKALMLDEIINYVQSLQGQVEFLSMKLASVNPMLYDFGVDMDALMVGQERLSSMASPLPNVQQCSPGHPPVFSETANILGTSNNYPILDSSTATLLHQQGHHQMADDVLAHQGNGQLLREVDDDQRQKCINQSGFSNSLFSFHQ